MVMAILVSAVTGVPAGVVAIDKSPVLPSAVCQMTMTLVRLPLVVVGQTAAPSEFTAGLAGSAIATPSTVMLAICGRATPSPAQVKVVLPLSQLAWSGILKVAAWACVFRPKTPISVIAAAIAKDRENV